MPERQTDEHTISSPEEKLTAGDGIGAAEVMMAGDARHPDSERAMPSKVLLVDDEREFVETLSERLQMRDVGSSVVFDGESALEMVRRDEPEVMEIGRAHV